ncbi:MAG: ORF6N domain-containing protein [Rickettsiales bacterium]|jgi:hypothetical protein|nr:ORF6N domain-containing protein [Rickettsiales bacterium]
MKNIKSLIYEIRGAQVMLDGDLAQLYGMEAKRLNESVKRNIGKFPPEFMFQITLGEWDDLKSQIATSSLNNISILKSQIVTSRWGGRRKPPFVFTEHGVVMLASVLNSPAAIQMNIAIVKSFISMRDYVSQPIHKKLEDLEKILMLHIDDTSLNFAGHSDAINEIIDKLNNMMEHPRPKRQIGFKLENSK